MAGVTKDRGYVSLLILFVIVFLTAMGINLFYKTGAQERNVRYEAQKVKAAFLADSGLEWAKASLTEDPDWGGGVKPLAEGKIEVKVTRNPQGYQVISESKYAGAAQSRCGIFAETADRGFVLIEYRELHP